MKRLFMLVVAMVLVLSGTACSKPQVSVTEHKGSITSSSSKASTPSKAEVVYTQLLTEKLTKSTLYQEAVLNSNAVIRYNGAVLTSRRAVDTFQDSYSNKKQADLYVYNFYDSYSSCVVYRNQIQYLPTENKLLYLSTSAEGELLEPNATDTIGWSLQWGEETKSELKNLSFTKYGCIAMEDELSSEASYTQVISDYELFDNYDENVKLREKYTEPIYLLIALGRTFGDVNEISDWTAIYESIYKIVDPNKNEGNLWATYPDSLIPISDVMKLINKYFDVDKQTVTSKLDRFMVDSDTIRFEDGRGGAYPSIVVTGYKEDGEQATITCRLRNIMTGDLDESSSYALTVKNLTDGSFRYLSLQKIEGEK